MKGKLVTTFVLLVMIITACGGESPPETPVPTAAETLEIPITGATATEAVIPTDTPVTAPTPAAPSPTPEPPRPTNLPDCTNSAAFVTDVTIPDNSEMIGDTPFVKTWRIANTGTCIWAGDYTLAPYSGNTMSSPASVTLPLTYPGQTADISISLKAPNTVAKHTGYFVIRNPAGLIMKINSDSRLWVVIDVKSAVSATATTAPATVNTSSTTTTGSGTSGNGFATVSCAFTLDPAKVTAVLDAINAYRTQSGLPAYNINPQLTLAAQAHANDMACNKFFVHTGSNGSTPQSRVIVSGYVASAVGENVYGSYPPLTGAEAVDWWKNDKTDLRHNLNLVSDKYIDVGIGYSFFDNYGYYAIVFGTP